MNPCTHFEALGVDYRYVVGQDCTWHGPMSETSYKLGAEKQPQPCCPRCSGDLLESPNEETWWLTIRDSDRSRPGYEDIIRWGRGKCFPDFETLENSYRQAMEGQQ